MLKKFTRLSKEKKDQLRSAKEAAIKRGSMARVQKLKKEINGLLVKEEKNVEVEISCVVVT